MIFNFLSFKVLLALARLIPDKSGTVTDVLVELFSEYNITIESFATVVFGEGTWVETNVEFLSQFSEREVIKPAFLSIFSASEIVLFVTSGTVILLSEEFTFASSDVTPR